MFAIRSDDAEFGVLTIRLTWWGRLAVLLWGSVIVPQSIMRAAFEEYDV